METPATGLRGRPAESRLEKGSRSPIPQIITYTTVAPDSKPNRSPRTPLSDIVTTTPGPLYGARRHGDRLVPIVEPPESGPPPAEFEMEDFLTRPPFSASQVQCVLWLSWTTTATPTQIARMHNRAFRDSSAALMSRWDVVDIENDIATHWHERGGSFCGMEPTPLLIPPGSNTPYSCLCDFGVQDCYDYRRDAETAENLEKLSMARMLWDATPKEMVRCPHGRRRKDAAVLGRGSRSRQRGGPIPRPHFRRSTVAGRVLVVLALLVAIIFVSSELRSMADREAPPPLHLKAVAN